LYRRLRTKYDRIHQDFASDFRPQPCETEGQTEDIQFDNKDSRAHVRGSASTLISSEEESDGDIIDNQTITMIWTLNK
jgi:hypothetical protein